MLGAKEPDEFKDLDFSIFSNDLDQATIKELQAQAASLNRQDGKAEDELRGFLSRRKIIEGVLRKADINTRPVGKTGKETLEDLILEINNSTARFMEAKGKEAKDIGDADLEAISRAISAEVITDKGRLWDTSKRVFKLGPEEEFFISIDDIPEVELTEIRAAFEEKRKEDKTLVFTDDDVKRVWKIQIEEARRRAPQ